MTENITDLVAEYLEIKARMAEIETELKAQEPGRYEAGEHVLTVATTTRFDKAAFERDYPIEEYPDLYATPEPSVDPKRIEDETKTAYIKPSATRLVIK